MLSFQLTAANTDDRKPVPDLTFSIFGKLFGDKGYISLALFEQLYERGLKLITRYRKDMNNRLVPLVERILLRKRAIIESSSGELRRASHGGVP